MMTLPIKHRPLESVLKKKRIRIQSPEVSGQGEQTLGQVKPFPLSRFYMLILGVAYFISMGVVFQVLWIYFNR